MTRSSSITARKRVTQMNRRMRGIQAGGMGAEAVIFIMFSTTVALLPLWYYFH
jgi:hypothetical protein